MAKEKIEFEIDAEDKASAKVREVEEHIKQATKRITDMTEEAHAGGVAFAELAESMGSEEVELFAHHIEGLTGKMSALVAMAGKAGLAMKFLLPLAAAFAGFALGGFIFEAVTGKKLRLENELLRILEKQSKITREAIEQEQDAFQQRLGHIKMLDRESQHSLIATERQRAQDTMKSLHEELGQREKIVEAIKDRTLWERGQHFYKDFAAIHKGKPPELQLKEAEANLSETEAKLAAARERNFALHENLEAERANQALQTTTGALESIQAQAEELQLGKERARIEALKRQGLDQTDASTIASMEKKIRKITRDRASMFERVETPANESRTLTGGEAINPVLTTIEKTNSVLNEQLLELQEVRDGVRDMVDALVELRGTLVTTLD